MAYFNGTWQWSTAVGTKSEVPLLVSVSPFARNYHCDPFLRHALRAGAHNSALPEANKQEGERGRNCVRCKSRWVSMIVEPVHWMVNPTVPRSY